MTWFDRSHFTLDGTTDQRQVANDIQQFVTRGFVVKIQLHIVEDTAFFHCDFRLFEESRDMVKLLCGDIAVDKHDSVGQVTAFDEVTADECLQFMQENEGSTRSYFTLEIIQVVKRSILLIKDFGVVFHLDIDFKPLGWLNLQLDAQHLVFVGNRFIDDKIIAGSILLDDARLMNGFNEKLPLPSMMGVSSTSMSINTLSMPIPRSEAKTCSTV